MRAVRIHAYGGPEVLMVEEVARPEPGPRDLLVRLRAAAVNPVDWKIRSGGQRNIIRYRFPWILGLDGSGVVEAVGADVRRFRVGDEVWSSPTHTRPGTYAEYACIDERECARKPMNLTHVEAASMPLVGLTAYQCLIEKGKLRAKQRVLIEAGAGGVGSFAIQLAKHLGAHVITTASARNADFVRALGADEVIDYTKERAIDRLKDVDLVLDTIGLSALGAHVAALRRGGRLSNISLDIPDHVRKFGAFFSLFSLGAEIARLYVEPLARKGVRARHVIKRSDGQQLEAIAKLVELGAIKPTIDRVLPLSEIREAHRISEGGHARGKIVLRCDTV